MKKSISPYLLTMVFFFLAAGRTMADEAAVVGRGLAVTTMEASGTIIAEDTFKVLSPTEGRLEALPVAVHSWVHRSETAAVIINPEAAAMLDSGASAESLSDHWDNRFKPLELAPRADGLVLRVFAGPNQEIVRNAPLFEAAKSLRLLGSARGEGARWIAAGQKVTFRLNENPGKTLTTVIDEVKRTPGDESSASFSARVKQQLAIAPDSSWEGVVHVDFRRDNPVVPTQALILHDGAYYVAVLVSTGATVSGMTEVHGVPERSRILILGGTRADAPEFNLSAKK